MKITEFKPQVDPSALGVGSSAGGDLGGTMPAPVVEGIGGSPIAPGAPFAPGDILTYDGTSWVPGPVDFSAVLASDLATMWEPLANGDPVTPELIFAAGDVIMGEVPV